MAFALLVAVLVGACAPMATMFDADQPGYCLAVPKMKKMSMTPYCPF